MDTMTIVILALIGVAALALLYVLYRRRRLGMTWRGVVEEVRIHAWRDQPEASQTGKGVDFVIVWFRTSDDQRRKETYPMKVYNQLYPDGLQAGDPVEKRDGQWYPQHANA